MHQGEGRSDYTLVDHLDDETYLCWRDSSNDDDDDDKDYDHDDDDVNGRRSKSSSRSRK